MTRRAFLGAAAAGVMAAETPEAIRSLRPMTAGVKPISDEERRGRLANAQRLMQENKIDAIILEPGSSLFYFTGIRWSRSERMFAMVLPAHGNPSYIAPAFESLRASEQIHFGHDIRLWQEDEDPAAVVARVFRDRNIATGRIGIEEQVRFFLYDGIRKAAPAFTYVDATPVTAGCRMIKSPAEIALLEHGNRVSLAAIKAAAATVREGMTQHELRANLEAAYRALGYEGEGLVNLGKYS